MYRLSRRRHWRVSDKGANNAATNDAKTCDYPSKDGGSGQDNAPGVKRRLPPYTTLSGSRSRARTLHRLDFSPGGIRQNDAGRELRADAAIADRLVSGGCGG